MRTTTIMDDGRGTEMKRFTYAKRERLPGRAACAWCGTPFARFSYFVSDGGRVRLLGAPVGQGKPFCSIGCFRSYCS